LTSIGFRSFLLGRVSLPAGYENPILGLVQYLDEAQYRSKYNSRPIIKHPLRLAQTGVPLAMTYGSESRLYSNIPRKNLSVTTTPPTMRSDASRPVDASLADIAVGRRPSAAA
jgi:hypothetical protein